MKQLIFIEDVALGYGVNAFSKGEVVEVDYETDNNFVVVDKFGFEIGVDKEDSGVAYLIRETESDKFN